MTVLSSEIILRAYRSADWPRLCAIHDAARLDELRLSVGVDAFLRLDETFQNEGLFDGTVCVAELDGAVRGFVAFGDGELTWLYVEPAFYRRGIGRALVRHAVAASGADIALELLDGNMPAQRLYESEGFSVAHRVDGKLAGNEGFAASGLVMKRSGERGEAG